MVRGNGDVKYDLAAGEPVAVKFSFTDQAPSWTDLATRYPPYRGHKELLEQLQYIVPDKHVVVTNGCKQAIFAAVYALKETKKSKYLHHHQEYFWPSYQTIADFNGLQFSAGPRIRPLSGIEVVTWPNNPDGLRQYPDANRHYDIWDAAYASPIYGFRGKKPDHSISTWSAAKLFGIPGLRIGWASTNRQDLADLMAQYVEKTTSGVNLGSQLYLRDLIKVFRASKSADVLEEMRTIHQRIQRNGDLFRQYLGGCITDLSGVPALNDGGMFSFFRVSNQYLYTFPDALKKAGVKLVAGNACGASIYSWRMSMGQTNEFTEEALQALQKALKEPNG